MAKYKHRIPKTTYSVAFQNMFLQRKFPTFTFYGKGGTGVWQGTLKPLDTAPTYHLKIEYRIGKRPQIWVIKPSLRKGAPHVYPDGSLCLFWYREWEWSKDQDLSQTVVPWAAMWLYYYEIWLDTGDWIGPAAPHSPALGERRGKS